MKRDHSQTFTLFFKKKIIPIIFLMVIFVIQDSHAWMAFAPAWQNRYLKLFAGQIGGPGNTDGRGDAARFNTAMSVAVDPSGNVYVADTLNHLIRKISAAGIVTTLAGAGVPGAADGIGTAALFSWPTGVALDPSGNLYVADEGNNLIRKVTATGVVTTLAGTAGVSGSANGIGTAALFSNPTGVAVDSAGNVYVADSANNIIRKISSAGAVTTLAGTAGIQGSSNGTGSAASFLNPTGVAVDSSGNVYVADEYYNIIRKVTPTGVVTTLAGTAGGYGAVDGIGGSASFSGPTGIAVDFAGNVYVADLYNNLIRKISSSGVVSTLAGKANIYGSSNGTGSAALFNNPAGVAADFAGNIYVADQYNHLIRKISSAGVVSTVAGKAFVYGSSNGIGAAASFSTPKGIAVDPIGNIFVADTANSMIRKISPAGLTSIFAGTPSISADGVGASASFYNPTSSAVDSAGNVYVADTYNQVIRKITSAGVVTTLAGTAGVGGSADGFGAAASFNIPIGVAVDVVGNIYVADQSNHLIRKITSSGVVTTLAGTAGVPGSVNGTGAAAKFNSPSGVAVDLSGNIYVADQSNHLIRKITSSGVVTTLAGTAGVPGSVNSTGTAAKFNSPSGVAVDPNGNIYVADQNNNLIRKVTAAGVVITLAGSGAIGSANGTGVAASFSSPSGVAVDSTGNVYVADNKNNLIRKVTAAGVVNTLAGSGAIGSANGTGVAASFNSPSGIAVDLSGNIYVADAINNMIRKINLAGVTTNFAGAPPGADGIGVAARFNNPNSSAVDSAGNIYVSDQFSNTIRKITPGGVVTTLAGISGVNGSSNGIGTAASFYNPGGVAVDSAGNLYVADTYNNLIRKINTAGLVTTLAGAVGVQGSADGTGTAASFSFPEGVAVDSQGNVYVADTGNSLIRKITSTGVVTTLAGKAGVIGFSNGIGAAASFSSPKGIAVDLIGNIYVADYGNSLIRKMTPIGAVTTILGSAGKFGTNLGRTPAIISYPTSIAVDSKNIFITSENAVLHFPKP